MIKRGMMLLLACALAVTTVVACGDEANTVSDQEVQVAISEASAVTDTGAGAALVADVATEGSEGATLIAATVAENSAAPDGAGDEAAESSASAFAEASATYDEAEDLAWDSAAVVPILLNGSSISVDGDGVTVAGSQATITEAGIYSLSGTLADGQIVVDSGDKGVVRLILNGVVMRSSTSAPIYVLDAEEAMILLADRARGEHAPKLSPQ